MDPPTVPARVVKVLGRIGPRGLLTEVRVELLNYPRMHMLRAVKGPVRLGEVIRVPDAVQDIWRS